MSHAVQDRPCTDFTLIPVHSQELASVSSGYSQLGRVHSHGLAARMGHGTSIPWVVVAWAAAAAEGRTRRAEGSWSPARRPLGLGWAVRTTTFRNIAGCGDGSSASGGRVARLGGSCVIGSRGPWQEVGPTRVSRCIARGARRTWLGVVGRVIANKVHQPWLSSRP